MMPRTNWGQRMQAHIARLSRMSDHDEAMVLHHFLGALSAQLEPRSCINKGPTRESVCRALERAINAHTGT